MKICLISFDYWNYDKHIVTALQKKGIQATHIDISEYRYKYKNIFQKIGNFLNKLFLKKNIKKIKRQEYILDTLNHIGKQDRILVIRPDLIEKRFHKKIKQKTDQYIAYIYDSCTRFPVDHLLDNIFDRIFSFDLKDVETYNFEHITNYIYLDKQPIETHFKYDVFIVLSPDERIQQLNQIAKQLDAQGLSYKFIVVGSRKPSNLYKNIDYTATEVNTDQLKSYLKDSRVILDLLRHNHHGLSFRIFEALAYQKKIMTTNASVKKYDFYDPNNILVLDPENIAIDSTFFTTEYRVLEDEVYHQFTVDHFADTIFNLND